MNLLAADECSSGDLGRGAGAGRRSTRLPKAMVGFKTGWAGLTGDVAVFVALVCWI